MDAIQNGKVVTMAYKLKDSDGQDLDQADENDPFEYLHGHKNIVPGLESALTGLKAGDKKSVQVEAAEGYGELIPELILTLDRSAFPQNAQLVEGMSFRAESGGQEMIFRVEKIAGDKITIDGNHPLAGEQLNFEVEVLEIRDATPQELAHGHVHGPNHSH